MATAPICKRSRMPSARISTTPCSSRFTSLSRPTRSATAPLSASARTFRSSRPTRHRACLHKLRGAPEPNDTNGHAPIHPVDQRLLKKIENLGYAVALHFMYYNFARVHRTLKQTPAMAAGIADHVGRSKKSSGCSSQPDPRPYSTLVLVAFNSSNRSRIWSSVVSSGRSLQS